MIEHPDPMQEFVALLVNHQEILRAYIISQVPGSPDVHDLLQEINMLLCRKMSDFTMGTNFGAWACTLAYYRILDYRKAKRKEGILVFSEELCRSFAEESVEREAEHLEAKRRALDHCLTMLKPRDREILEARYRWPSTSNCMRDASVLTGRSRASLRVSLSRLRSVLRDCIVRKLHQEGGIA